SYSDFKEHLQEESERLHFTYDTHHSTWYYAKSIPTERSKLFLECVTGKNLDVELSQRVGDDHAIAVKMTWNAPPGQTRPVKFDFSQSNNVQQLPSVQNATFRDREQRTLVFR